MWTNASPKLRLEDDGTLMIMMKIFLFLVGHQMTSGKCSPVSRLISIIKSTFWIFFLVYCGWPVVLDVVVSAAMTLVVHLIRFNKKKRRRRRGIKSLIIFFFRYIICLSNLSMNFCVLLFTNHLSIIRLLANEQDSGATNNKENLWSIPIEWMIVIVLCFFLFVESTLFSLNCNELVALEIISSWRHFVEKQIEKIIIKEIPHLSNV